MAVQEKKNQDNSKKPVLDERFITTISGRDFCLYSGLLDLAHQIGIQMIQVDVVQFATKENGFEAICKATVESKNGQTFIECGDANPKNVNPKISGHILRMAATRAKARALRDFTNIGMTCLEELGDLDEAIGDERPSNGRSKKSEAAKPESGNAGNGKQTTAPASRNEKQSSSPSNGGNGGKTDAKRTTKPTSKEEPPNGGNRENSGPKPSTAQIRAIENLARRRNISAQELEDMVQQQFGTTLPNINSSEASSFIRLLQQSA